MGKGGEWRAVATGESLMRSLHIVVPHESRCGGLGVLQVRRPVEGQALLLIGAVVPFDKAVLLGGLRVADHDLDAEAGAKTKQGRRKIAARRTADPARIAIEGDGRGAAILG